MSQCLLARLTRETEWYLSEWQAGFRQKRGCRDNTLTLRAIYDELLSRNETLYAAFIDYTAAFDSVSHKFLDQALEAAKASNKCRAIFRAVCASATARTKVGDTDGKFILSEAFTINRGVVQGDITSPLYFILALELLLKVHDTGTKGVNFGSLRVHTLGYADDAALASHAIEKLTQRLSNISKGSRADANMYINKYKTKSMDVTKQIKLTSPTIDVIKAIEATYEHECKFCGRMCN